ncbi:hypothetical protein [Glaciibacter psychrotolerans]|uniref:Uncharacterized protein n=1 Tax=Glaciibacter psychrotolerans TaxID=670054 RepID=A0A7Z0ED90_9MICO|nr:hypothetical protein [Leifsonia psychrotolerans]NYJ19291.1 hypothetical protein [Leifsonia psychrotolerans]
MVEDRKSRAAGTYAHLFEWVEDKLRPAFENPPAGIYEATTISNLSVCPICGHSMQEHTIDHSSQNTLLICPGPPVTAGDRDVFKRVNEFGMVINADAKPDPTAE